MNLEELTKLEFDHLFRINKRDTLPYEREDTIWVSVTIGRDLDLGNYERNVYTSLDLFSDIGGFQGLLVSLLAMVSSAWNYHNFANFMVSRLFRIKKP